MDAAETAAFAELVGGLASGDMRAELRTAAADLGRSVEELAVAADGTNPLYSSRVVGETFQEGRNLQDEALHGPAADHRGSGLVVSKDGLSWERR